MPGMSILRTKGEVEGYAIVVTGSSRASYLTKEGNTTHDEKKAAILSKAGAFNLMHSKRDSALYKRLSIISTNKSMYKNHNGLPTINGY